jgi:hypothetical protein
VALDKSSLEDLVSRLEAHLNRPLTSDERRLLSLAAFVGDEPQEEPNGEEQKSA